MPTSPDTEQIEKQLKVIGILFLVLAGFCLLMLIFIPIHYMMMQSFVNIDFPGHKEGPDPRKIFQEMQSSMVFMYVFMGGLLVLTGGFMLATGINLLRRRHWTLCVIGSALICPSFPLGTALGIWSLLTLFDKKTKPLFAERAPLEEADFLD